jgi:hypothetical protein
MAQTDSKSPNTSVDFKNDINNYSDEKNFANISLIGEFTQNKHSSECSNCLNLQKTIEKLKA